MSGLTTLLLGLLTLGVCKSFELEGGGMGRPVEEALLL
jgi:hypothetical protein